MLVQGLGNIIGKTLFSNVSPTFWECEKIYKFQILYNVTNYHEYNIYIGHCPNDILKCWFKTLTEYDGHIVKHVLPNIRKILQMNVTKRSVYNT